MLRERALRLALVPAFWISLGLSAGLPARAATETPGIQNPGEAASVRTSTNPVVRAIHHEEPVGWSIGAGFFILLALVSTGALWSFDKHRKLEMAETEKARLQLDEARRRKELEHAREQERRRQEEEALRREAEAAEKRRIAPWVEAIRKRDPAFDVEAFRRRVAGVFVQVQKAVTSESRDYLEPIRHLIAKASVQSFDRRHALLKRKYSSRWSEDQVHVFIEGFEQTESDFLLEVTISDEATHPTIGLSDSGWKRDVLWTFSRSADSQTGNDGAVCSYCGAPLPEPGASSCASCGAALNGSDRSWVVAEILDSFFMPFTATTEAQADRT